jgi:hypothetical protein
MLNFTHVCLRQGNERREISSYWKSKFLILHLIMTCIFKTFTNISYRAFGTLSYFSELNLVYRLQTVSCCSFSLSFRQYNLTVLHSLFGTLS